MEIFSIALLTLFASMVGTITGFGTSTIMVPLLSIFLPVPTVLPLVGIIHWWGDLWKMILFRSGIRWRLVLYFGIPGILFSYLGASLVIQQEQLQLSQWLGLFMMCYVAFLFLKPDFKIPAHNAYAVAGGTLSGFFAGIFGVGGAIRGLFLSAFDLPKTVYIFTSGIIAIFIDTTRLATYFSGDYQIDTSLFWGLLLFIPISFVGAKLGQYCLKSIPQQSFRKWVAVFLFLVAVKLLLS